MGLDMTLSKKTYIGNKYRKKGQLVKVVVPKNQKDVLFKTGKIDDSRVNYIEEEVAYWRKANAIHNWFVKNVQGGEDDCGTYPVSKEDLESLLETVEEVLENSELIEGKVQNGSKMEKGMWIPILEDGKIIKDSRVAKKLLPTAEGFFFGGTGYDQYYIESLKYTRDTIKKLLTEEGEFNYQSSW